MSAQPLATASAVSVGWGGSVVLRDVTLTVPAGESIVLVGPNGSGKSTLLLALLGLRRPLAGTILRAPHWRAGYVPQHAHLAPLLRFSARDVVAMGALPERWLPGSGSGRRREAALDALRAVDVDHLAGRVFRDLSGGQRQRVLLARALARGPNVLVLDEPTLGLDLRAEQEFLSLLRTLRSDRGLAVVAVTHSLAIAAREADRIGLVDGGRVRFGSRDEILDPAVLASVYGDEVDLSLHVLGAAQRGSG